MERPSHDVYFMRMAQLVATRSTCARRSVGAVLVDERNHVVGTGYNGRPSGETHCAGLDGDPCAGAGASSGTQLEACEAIHAEQNALLQCRDVYAIQSIYTTAFPCVHCLKLLLNTSCRWVFYSDDYGAGVELRRRWGHLLSFTQVQP